MLIYVSGPLTASTEAEIRDNIEDAIEIGLAILKRGHTPFIPHLTYFVGEYAEDQNIHIPYEDYIDWDLRILERCDALYYIGPSKGANIERKFAEDNMIPVFTSLVEIGEVTQ